MGLGVELKEVTDAIVVMSERSVVVGLEVVGANLELWAVWDLR